MRVQVSKTALALIAALNLNFFWPNEVTAADCHMTSTLTIKDAQSGFAGRTGTIWTIKPDCSFEVARFRQNQIDPPHLKGKLTAEQTAQLAAVLSAAAVDTLPAQIGESPPVNPHQLTIEYGGKSSVLNLDMGDQPRARGANDPAQRVLDITETVKAVTGQ